MSETKWRPIETAPRNGEYILLGNKHGAWVGTYVDQYQSGYRPKHPWHSMMLNTKHMGRPKSLKPTYWMPLPEPPK